MWEKISMFIQLLPSNITHTELKQIQNFYIQPHTCPIKKLNIWLIIYLSEASSANFCLL